LIKQLKKMGQVAVSYKPQRGTSDDDKAYFQMILVSEFAQTSQLYKNADEEQKRAINEVFGEEIFLKAYKAESWYNLNEDNAAALSEAKEKIERILG